MRMAPGVPWKVTGCLPAVVLCDLGLSVLMVNTVPASCFHSGLDGLPRGLVWLLRGYRLASCPAGPPQPPLTFGMGSLSPRHVAGVTLGMATSVQRCRKESLVVLVTPLRPLAPVLSGLAEVAQSSGGGH